MSEIRVATRYARSLLDLSREKKSLEQVYSDAKNILQLLKENRELRVMIKSPVIHGTKKEAILIKIFSGQLSELTFKFIAIVIRKGRETVLEDIFKQFVDQYNKLKGISSATITTATPIDAGLKTRIKGMLDAKTDRTFEIENKVNREMIGGFILRYEDKLVDASILAQLKELQKHLAN